MNKYFSISAAVISVIFINLSNLCYAQNVTSTAGKHFYGSNNKLNWTIGEPVIKTFPGSNGTLSQGFHQPASGVPCGLSAIITSTDATCNAGNNGTATATATNGTSPFTYLWSDGQTDSTATGLTAGTYTVTVTDNNGCTATANTIISEPTALILSIITVDATCGLTDGIAIVSVSGGTPPYAYSWSGGDTTNTADSLASGIHIVTVTDSNGCSNFAIATISDFGGPTIITNTVTDVTCNGFADGAIDISIIGGTAPFTYIWSSGDTTQDISGLPAGPYEVAISDANGCTANKSITVNEPAALSLTITTIDASCGNANGTAVVAVTGGTIPYTYNWSSGGMGYIETGLSAGVYAVVVSDSNNCTAISSAAVSDTGAATITIDSILNEDCGSIGGSIYISVTGGATPYTYLWSDSSVTQDLVNVPAGSYDVFVTSANGCIATASATISGQQPSPQSICLVTVDSASGNNLIVWEKTPGTSSYNIYRETTQSGVYFLAGTLPYDSLSTYLDPLSNPMQKSYRYKISATDTCGNESDLSTKHKTIHLTINQGLGGDINLIWNHYEGFTFSSYYIYRYTPSTGWQVIDSIQSNLNSFTDPSPPQANLWYQVVVKHPSVCTATVKTKDYNSSKSNTTSISLTETLTANATATDADQGICNGTATVTTTGGAEPYTYLWNDTASQTTAIATGLCGNTTYTILVTDANEDTVTTNVFVDETTSINPKSQILNPKFTVYPNPNTGEFTIEMEISETQDIQLKIFNILGQAVYSETLNYIKGNYKKNIDLKPNPAGIYNLQILNNNNIINRKIILNNN